MTSGRDDQPGPSPDDSRHPVTCAPEPPRAETARRVPRGAPGGADASAFTSRAPRFVRRSGSLRLTWRICVFLVGVAIIAAGIAMLVLPGPGWVAIFLGLAVLGTEFVWAQRALRWSRQQAQRAAGRALDPRTRRRNLAFLATGVALAAGGAAIYVGQSGLPW
jgi:uncharacterized protein (TIGR02611 family)